MNLICNKYRRIRKIGMGTFCNVYLGEDIENGLKVAIKMDKCREEESRSLLPHEYKVYAQLAGCEGIPVVHLFGQERGYNVIVMDKLGPSLEDLFNFCSRRFSLKTVMMLVDQMITKRNERIMEKKLATSIEDLCAGLPEEFGSYLQYCRSMSFDEQPDYQYWISTFREVLSANELKYDLIFDWHGLMPSEAAEQDSNNASATTADES
ncbi:AGAP004901-PA [Anopheles gambiae str. PEST]|uniref:AGAP004901-PA n=1 Tax=Anopheles gambiae TaxID=7165 RepID=Q7Q819_ANOGA|nr:AGAP004901-PA [Anopheles gambiae str. PEST]